MNRNARIKKVSLSSYGMVYANCKKTTTHNSANANANMCKEAFVHLWIFDFKCTEPKKGQL